MARSTDRTSAALLVATVVLVAGSFAGFSFGATGADLRNVNPATPLLLQSASVASKDVPCLQVDHRHRSAPTTPADPAPAPVTPRVERARPTTT